MVADLMPTFSTYTKMIIVNFRTFSIYIIIVPKTEAERKNDVSLSSFILNKEKRCE